MKFDKIPVKTFEQLPLGAGMAFSKFNVEPGPEEQNYAEEDILGATSGGINFSAVLNMIDRGEGIDNCPKGMMELMDIDTVDVKSSGTFTTMTPKLAKILMAAAELSGNKLTPRKHLKKEDFFDLWLVCDYGNDGMIAIHILNALSSGGFQLQTADKDKGKASFEFTGHYSMDHQDTVPYEVYVEAGSPAAAKLNAIAGTEETNGQS